jgi:lipase ATG15
MYLPTFLALFWPSAPQRPLDPPKPQEIEVRLRHVHAHSGGRVVFKDVNETHLQAFSAVAETSYSFTPISQKTYRPRSQNDFFRAREVSKGRMRKRSHSSEKDVVVIWDEWEVPGPNHGSRDTLIPLAQMTWNSYMTPEDGTWYDLGDAWPNVGLLYISEGLCI